MQKNTFNGAEWTIEIMFFFSIITQSKFYPVQGDQQYWPPHHKIFYPPIMTQNDMTSWQGWQTLHIVNIKEICYPEFLCWRCLPALNSGQNNYVWVLIVNKTVEDLSKYSNQFFWNFWPLEYLFTHKINIKTKSQKWPIYAVKLWCSGNLCSHFVPNVMDFIKSP